MREVSLQQDIADFSVTCGRLNEFSAALTRTKQLHKNIEQIHCNDRLFHSYSIVIDGSSKTY